MALSAVGPLSSRRGVYMGTNSPCNNARARIRSQEEESYEVDDGVEAKEWTAVYRVQAGVLVEDARTRIGRRHTLVAVAEYNTRLGDVEVLQTEARAMRRSAQLAASARTHTGTKDEDETQGSRQGAKEVCKRAKWVARVKGGTGEAMEVSGPGLLAEADERRRRADSRTGGAAAIYTMRINTQVRRVASDCLCTVQRFSLVF
ncbi:hypothetical protein K438DRAFT_2078836 [Mycena galopus ATCC 62051]|nr:hypothetical protein K438DRAFT_2078836 [Mycena galopus ATCC 62051]